MKFPPITDKDRSTLLGVMKHIIEKNYNPKKIIVFVVSTMIGIDKIRRNHPEAIIVALSLI